MRARELIEELLKHDLDLEVYLIDGNDLMAPSLFTEADVKFIYKVATPPKLDDAKLYPSSENESIFYVNSLLIHWT